MLKVKRLHPNAKLPTKAYPTDLGYDLYALEDTLVIHNQVTKIRTGIACRFPEGYGALICDRSSVATKLELMKVAGVIDPTYTGEIIVALYNHVRTNLFNENWTNIPQIDGLYPGERIEAGTKIAQMVLIESVNFPVEEVNELEETDRSDKGFGSSGVK